MDNHSSSATLAKPVSSSNPPVVIDLGKHRRKRVKDLRKGKPGRLLDEVNQALSMLKSQGTVSPEAQPVIIVVRERRRNGRMWPGM